jgi:hypothetical protein
VQITGCDDETNMAANLRNNFIDPMLLENVEKFILSFIIVLFS